MTLRDILERGYFPKELPPPFVTSSFADIVTSVSGLPRDLQSNIQVPRPQIRIAKASRYSLARGGLLRRKLSIANPVLHYLLCREMYLHWDILRPNIGGTPLSSTSPEFKPNGRAIDGLHPQSARPHIAIQTRLNKRYILRTDISRFYHSIYTHSIPWALLTKPVAKTNRGMEELGNRLDYLVRQGQDGQTVGIPIGPDTSLVIAEAIMQACDRKLLSELPQLRGYRFIDDYELSFRHRKEAEDAFHILEKTLSEYELSLNPKKTGIEELPCYLEPPWVGSLRTFPIRTGKGQEGDLINYFDLSFGLQRSYPDDPVLQYAVGRLKTLSINEGNWKLFQRLLLNCAVPEPATLNHVLEAIIIRFNAGASPEIPQIEEAINSIIYDHSSLGHSSEVAWALLTCLALRIPISASACDELSRCDDSVVALLALHCESEQLCALALDKSNWLNYMNQEGLYEDHWLLSYEANLKGWLPSQGGRDHVAQDPNFGFLKSMGVSFYDIDNVRPDSIAPIPVPLPPTPPPSPGGY